MVVTPDFNPADLAEARRLNPRPARLPRLRMQTPVGRVALNALLRLVEIYPLLKMRKHGLRTELRVIEAFGQSVKLRIFRPNNPVRGVVLDLHGGGWTIGNARMADGQNANLALRLNVAVVSVDYTLALAGPIEASILECAAAMSWLTACAQRDFGAAKVIIKGFSSGAHLAAWALIRLRAHDEVMNRIAGIPRSRRFTATSKGCRQRSWWWAPKTSFCNTIKGWPHVGTPPTAMLTCWWCPRARTRSCS